MLHPQRAWPGELAASGASMSRATTARLQTGKQPADQWRAYSQTISSASAKQHLKTMMAAGKKHANLADLQHTYAAPVGQPPLPPIPMQPAPAYLYAESALSRGQTMGSPGSPGRQQQQQQPQYQALYESSQFPLAAPSSLHVDRALSLSRPLCRCRVMYLGSSVPHITKNGLHGIQEPLKRLYPDEQFSGSSAGRVALADLAKAQQATTIDISHLSSSLGIDSWLSVWSNGLLLQNVDEFGQEIKRFFSIESLHYCAAVRYFDTSSLKSAQSELPVGDKEQENRQRSSQDQNNNISIDQQSLGSSSALNGYDKLRQAPPSVQSAERARATARFLPLDAPLFQVPGMMDPSHPPVFAAIMRRTSGIKVLECHTFICRRDAAANALVRCCTHAYADLLSARRLSVELATAALHRQSWSPLGQPLGAEPLQTATLGRHLLRKHKQREPVDQFVRRKSASSVSRTGSSLDEPDEGRQSRSSEDNYAIISRHAKPDGGPARPRERNNSKSSCKSLFSDFQPKAQPLAEPRSFTEAKVEKVSQSMELLGQLEQQHDDLQVDYSVVNSKRHSRSMQNLGQTGAMAEFCASSARSSSRLGRDRKRQPEPAGSGRARPAGSRERRAASMHDMSLRACQLTGQLAKAERQQDEGCLGRGGLGAEGADVSAAAAAACARASESSSRAHSRSRKQSRRSRSGDRHRSSSRQRRRAHEAQVYEVPRLPACGQPVPLEPLLHSTGQPVAYSAQPAQPPFCLGPAVPAYLDGLAPLAAYGLAYPLHPALYQQQQQHQLAAMFAAASAAAGGATLSARARHNGRSLARFRCLSPPINLVAGAPSVQPRDPRSSLAPSEGSPAAQEAQPASVVSGQPGFLAGGRAKRLSWIKRLSLTLSGSSRGLANEPADLSAEPRSGANKPPGQASAEGGAQRRRRSNKTKLQPS